MKASRETKVQTELKRLYEGKNAPLKAEEVVEWARDNPESALHEEFDWNDTVAAQKWRLQQARELLRLEIGYTERRPQFVSVKIGTGRIGYVPREDQLESDRQSLVLSVYKAIRGYRKTNGDLDELKPIWDAVDKLEKRLLPD